MSDVQPGNSSPLIAYRKTTFMLSNWLRQLETTANTLEMTGLTTAIAKMRDKVEFNTFSIAVVGEFNRGKSTLINALLGQSILPADMLPTTAILTRIRYGIRRRATIHFNDGHVREIAITDLSQHVTKAAYNSSRIKEVVIDYPTAYCQDNVDIVDTPGLEDEAAMTAITLVALSDVDAAIFVVMAQSPFSKSEQDFLSDHLLKQSIERVLFVVTGIDRCENEQSTARVVQRVEARIRSTILASTEAKFGKTSSQYQSQLSRIDQINVIGVSAKQALAAKQHDNSVLLSQSRFADLEEALKQLVAKRGGLLLTMAVDRVLSTGDVLLRVIAQRQVALAAQRDCLDATYRRTVALCSNTQSAHSVIAQQQKTIQLIQERLFLLLSTLKIQLQQSLNETVTALSPALLIGEQTQIETRLNRLEQTITDKLETRSRRWAGLLQVELRRSLTNLIETLRPPPKRTLNWMNSVGLYGLQLGSAIKQQILTAQLACKTYQPISNQQGGTRARGIAQFSQDYTTSIEAIIDSQIATLDLRFQQLCKQLTELLSEVNPASWSAQEKQGWLVELRLNLAREETKVDLALQSFQTLKAETEQILKKARILKKQIDSHL